MEAFAIVTLAVGDMISPSQVRLHEASSLLLLEAQFDFHSES